MLRKTRVFIAKTKTILAATALVTAPVLTLLTPGIAHAASITWTGGGTDGNWSTAANWQGGVAPVSGDSVVIDNSANFANGTQDDIAGLNLAGITFTNDASSGGIAVLLTQPLTISGPITQAASVTTTSNSIGGSGGSQTITLGGNVTVTSSTGGLTLGTSGNGDTLALGGNQLTFTDYGGSTSDIVAIDADVTGTGGIVYNGAATTYQLWGNNTYSGTTHVMSSYLPVSNTGTNNNAFGTSAITIDSAGSVSLTYGVNTTVSNTIAVAGTTNGSPVTSVSFDDGGAPGVTITAPNITLNGETRFATSSTGSPHLQVNLAGIVANGYCVQYVGYGSANDGPSNGFLNGPVGCVVAASTSATPTPAAAPKAPNTGFELVSAHPVVTLVAAIACAGTILFIARKTSASRR